MNKSDLISQCEKSFGKNVRLKHLKKVLEGVSKIEKSVELGCREGWLIHNTSARKKVGYDLSPIRLFEDVDYIEQDILSLTPAHFDLVISSEVLEHIPDDRQTMKVMYGQLRAEGLIFLTTINSNIRKDKSEQDRRYGHIRRYGRELKILMESTGFVTLDFYPMRSPHYYSCQRDLGRYSVEQDKIEGQEEASGLVYIGRKLKDEF
ncbi:MAG: class I SAM-dependent methyltransferase [Nanoarchaeota archaeon]